MLLHLIVSGQGRGVLPCFIGDVQPSVIREGDIIEYLTTRLYIVVNDDDRRRPEVRMMMDRVAGLLSDHAELFAGRGGD